MPDENAPVSSQEVRDHLGTQVRKVHDRRHTVRLVLNGQPAGALVPAEVVQRSGLIVMGAHQVRQARRSWASVREQAIRQGPQAITDRSGAVAVLVSAEHAKILETGLPVLDVEILRFDGATLTDQNGRPIPSGTWGIAGAVLRVEPLPEIDGTSTTEGRDVSG